jgi:quercetin dioxygenase-like cupin family protein
MRFDDVQEVELKNFKGGEGALLARMVVDGENRLMRGRLAPGSSIGMHTHQGSCEMIYVIGGVGTVIMDGKEERLEPGDYHYCPENHTHSLCNRGTEELVFFAVVPKQ